MPRATLADSSGVSLLTRINGIILLTTAVVGIVAVVLSVQFTQSAQGEKLRRRAELVTALQADALAAPVWEFNHRRIQELVSALLDRESAIVALEVLDTAGGAPIASVHRDTAPHETTVVEQPIVLRRLGDQQETLGRLRIVYSLDEVRTATLAALGPVVGLLLTALVTAIAVISALINRLVLRPLAALTQASQRMAAGDYDARLDTGRSDEIGRLTRSFDAMARTVQEHTASLEHRVRARTQELSLTNEELADRNRRLTDSINYAQLIQTSILPKRGTMDLALEDHFVIWRPREVVSGDFYFCREADDGYVLGVADCTGHGVPGAFMTMTASAVLNTAVERFGAGDPASLLTAVDREVRAALHQNQDDTVDGFDDNGLDLALCYILPRERRLVFSGGRLSLLTVGPDGVEEIRGDRESLGYRRGSGAPSFTNHTVTLAPGRVFYIATDGITDQGGGQRGLSFGKRRLRETLARHWRLPMADQKATIERTLANYQSDRVQRDDITMFGFRVRLADAGQQGSEWGTLAAD